MDKELINKKVKQYIDARYIYWLDERFDHLFNYSMSRKVKSLENWFKRNKLPIPDWNYEYPAFYPYEDYLKGFA